MKALALAVSVWATVSTLVGGCAVVAVVDTAGTIAAKTVGVAADAAVGTVKIAGKVVGKAADAALGSGDAPKDKVSK